MLAARVHHRQANRIRSAMGTRLEVDGVALDVFPAPAELLTRETVPGLPAEKVTRLHGIARAALEGRLDRDRLLALDPAEAMAEVQALRGIGPFSAALIVLRAVGPTDALAGGEPRMRRAVALAYDRPEVRAHEGSARGSDDDDAFAALAETWRPYRTWVSVLMRATGSAPPGSA